METPKTFSEAVRYFANPDNALSFVASLRWPNGVVCPDCGAPHPGFLATRRVWKCRSCRKQFSVKVGTIFEDSAIPLDKWLIAIWMIANCKNGVSSYEIARDLKITQKSAWFMLHRIRLAMQSGTFLKLSGEVEVDESFIGGKARNMHLSKRGRVITGRGPKDKTAAFGMVQRGGNVVAMVIPNRKKKELHKHIVANVEPKSVVYTDELKSYDGLEEKYIHQVINHAYEYVNGNVHTNTMENFWSLLKRGLNGTYVSVEPYHLFRYLDEQAFRYNNRKLTDGDRFEIACSSISGKRVTWADLTGLNVSGDFPVCIRTGCFRRPCLEEETRYGRRGPNRVEGRILAGSV